MLPRAVTAGLVQTEYIDAFGQPRRASEAALAAVRKALGDDDGARCLVAWDGVLSADAPEGEIELEDGAAHLPGERLPAGYHTLHTGGRAVPILAAPARCWEPPDEAPAWGVFAPLYALRSARSDRHGGADFTDLAHCIDWIRSLGGAAVGTLPLLASFPDDPSPYLPLSHRFWNERYLDLGAVPEIDRVPDGTALAAEDPIDTERVFAHRRRALGPAAERIWATPSPRRAALEAWVAATPLADAYARFRARGDEAERRYHLYAQWLCGEQLAALAARGLYLDLPVGVHPLGFDAAHERDAFAPGVAVGAPPDVMFAGGQNWSIPALHPTRGRASGHRYFAECVRAHCRYARVLRIDHVMGLFRRFWIPDGMPATEGVYVRMPADELVAVLSIESHRHQTVIVGEDLGTVEPGVREEMARRGLRRIHVAQLTPHEPPPPGCVAGVNTHDTPTFAAGGGGRAELEAVLDGLARSPAWLVLATLEDLWLETRPQNVPGTGGAERPNWRGRMRVSLDELPARGDLIATLLHARRA